MITTWKEVGREEAFRKYSRKIEKVDFMLPSGKVADFYIKAEGPACAVLALTENREVILVRQYRPGPKQVLDELPGGYANPDEDAMEAMERELLEETGYKGKMQFVGECLDDAYSTMRRQCFVATDCKKVAEPEQTETEIVEVVLVPLAEFRNHLRKGQMTDVEVGYLGLDFLQEL